MNIFSLCRRAFLVSTIALGSGAPASAAVLYSISGVVGDVNNWTLTPSGDWEFNARLGQYFPVFSRSSGNVSNPEIDLIYNGPTIVQSFDLVRWFDFYDTYACLNPAGCSSESDYSRFGGDDNLPGLFRSRPAPVGVTSFTTQIDTNVYFTDEYSPGLKFPFSRFDLDWTGNNGFEIHDVVSASDVGLPYSFVLTTVPEPTTWAMFLIGFGAVGSAMRRNKEIATAAAI